MSWEVKMCTLEIERRLLKLEKGDITRCDADAIVNAANSHLKMGGGVAGAIRRAAGPEVQVECDRIGYCPVGKAVATGAGRLPYRHVIHAVGPRWGEGDEEQKLRSAYRSALELADRLGMKSVAFPAISAVIFGYPLEEAARVALEEARAFLASGPSSIEKVIFVLFEDRAFEAFRQALEELRGEPCQ